VALEALAVGVLGMLVLGRTPAAEPGVALGSGLLFLAYAAFLLAVARGVLRGRRWARSPAVATQLLHLPIAWSFRSGSSEAATAATAVALAAAVVLVCLLLPSSTAVFTGTAPGEPPSG